MTWTLVTSNNHGRRVKVAGDCTGQQGGCVEIRIWAPDYLDQHGRPQELEAHLYPDEARAVRKALKRAIREAETDE